MTALADALTAAQTRAVAALAKQYVGGQLDSDSVRIALDGIGLSDPTDTERWIAALDIIRETGAPAPAETAASGEEKATEKQVAFIAKLCDDKAQPVPDGPITKSQAHEIIETLQKGTYDAGKWSVPF